MRRQNASGPPEPPADAPPHDRLLLAAKGLFASQGYENATTVSIARLAGTSESQLMKHFGSKEGLLEAIFEEGWRDLNRRIGEALDELDSPVAKLDALVRTTTEAFESDPELRALMLLEGRRIRRGGRMVLLTEGYGEFIEKLDTVLGEMREAGALRPHLPIQAVRSALIGAFENLQRDLLLSARMGFPADFEAADMRDVFDVVARSFLRSPDS